MIDALTKMNIFALALRPIRTGTLAFALLLLGFAAPALAQTPEHLGKHRDWDAFTFMEGDKIACYMASRPTREEGQYTSRGDVYLLVTHRTSDNTRDVVSLVTGYTYKEDSVTEAQVGNATFSLFTVGDTAYSRNDEDDQRIVAAMKAGAEMSVKGVSARGTETVDTFSLRGFTAAYNQMTAACGL